LDDTTAEMRAAADARLLAEQYLDLFQASLIIAQPRARQRGRIAATTRLGKAEMDAAVLREITVGNEVEQTALSADIDFRQSAQWFTETAVGLHDAHASRSFGHQHATAADERERPGMFEPTDDDFGSDSGRGRLRERRTAECECKQQ